MEAPVKTKITPNEAICQMLLSLNEDRREGAYKVAESYLGTLSISGDWHWKIDRAIKGRPRQMRLLESMSGEIKNLIYQPSTEEFNVFLPAQLESMVNDLLIEWEYAEDYRFHNLGVRDKILLHGPTGNGKTTIARHIADRAQLPFIEVSSDQVIDSHVGGTAANINKLFLKIHQPCVLFWDEIDGIGMNRGGGNNAAGHENDRMVNSMLVNMDKMHVGVIFIGATNRLELLDPAFLRRFHERIEVGAPSLEEKANYLKKLYEFYKIEDTIVQPYVMSSCNSYSEIKKMFTAAARNYIFQKMKNKSENEQ